MQNAAEAANEAAAPVVAKLGELGIKKALPSSAIPEHIRDQAEIELTLQEFREAAMNSGRVDVGGAGLNPPSA